MLKNTKVEFVSGRLLTKEMLEVLNSRFALQLHRYSSYPDGVLYGFDFSCEADEIVMGTGAVKLDGDVYFLTERVNLQCFINAESKSLQEDATYTLVLEHAEDTTEAEGVVTSRLKLGIKRIGELTDNMLEVGTFTYTSSRNVQLCTGDDAYSVFENMYKQPLALNLTKLKYSLPTGTTFHPFVFARLAEVLEQKRDKGYMDKLLLAAIYQSRVVSKSLLALYANCYKADGEELLAAVLNESKISHTSDINAIYTEDKPSGSKPKQGRAW